MGCMFQAAIAFNQDLNNWKLNKSNPPGVKNMFHGAESFRIIDHAMWYI